MSVNGITSTTQTYDSRSSAKTKQSKNQTVADTNQSTSQDTAAVYEKSEQTVETNKTYKPDTVTIDKLKAEVERRTESLRTLVEKIMEKQGVTFQKAEDIYSFLREGKFEVDEATKSQAQKDISEDGYWGVEQTSDRIVSFAKALAGGDPDKAEELISAVEKGYEKAAKAWGGELPELCKKTFDTTMSKLKAWRDGTEDSKSMENTASESFTEQAATDKIAK